VCVSATTIVPVTMEADVGGDETIAAVLVQQKTDVSPAYDELPIEYASSHLPVVPRFTNDVSHSNIISATEENSSPDVAASSSSSSALRPITVGDRLYGQNNPDDVLHVTLDCAVIFPPATNDSMPGLYLFVQINNHVNYFFLWSVFLNYFHIRSSY
jgi:hypothetical protein